MATPDVPVLNTTQYVPPDVYLGEAANPQSANLSVDARVPTIVAKGNRLAIAQNQSILRAFVQNEQLTFSRIPPFVAPLQHNAQGQVLPPNLLYKQDGTQVPQNKWQYIQNNGVYNEIQISDDTFDNTATYYIDYQSIDRSVLDPLPIAELRQVMSMGLVVNESTYTEYVDFYIPTDFTAPVPDPSNVNPTYSFSGITQTLEAGSTGSMVYGSANEFDHDYSRSYTLQVSSISGVSPNRQAVVEWTASLESPGAAAAAPVPLQSSDSAPFFTLNEAVPASMIVDLEFGVQVQFDFGATQFVIGDNWAFEAFGAGLVEIDPRYQNGQFASVSAPSVKSGTANNYNILIDPLTAYNLTRNNYFDVKLLGTAGTAPNRQLTFVWARYGESAVENGIFIVYENVPTSQTQNLSSGVKIDIIIGMNAAENGTVWTMQAQAPQIYYKAKDSRNYTFNISSVTNPSGDIIQVNGGYSTNTTEGSFGLLQADYSPSNPVSPNDGYCVLADNVSVAFRNIDKVAAEDIFTFSISVESVIDWNLQAQVTDVKEVTDYLTDVNGNITGTAGLQYVVLTDVPTDGSSIQVQNYSAPNNFLSFNWIVGTQFIYFNVAPGVPIKISYLTLSQQPDPGNSYYLTASFLRPMSAYNNPFLVLRLQDGRNFAAPSTTTNDLYVGNEIAWANNAPAVYLVQPYNQDGSGNYSITDFQAAISSLDNYPRVTDVCLLNYITALPDVLAQNVEANNPFNKRPNLVWVGMPIATPVGDDNTIGSLVYTAKVTLQTGSTSAALGTRIMVGNTTAYKTITLQDGSSVQVTLDGSFLALAMAATVASFTDPATDILNVQVNGFDSIELYNSSVNNTLGAAQINYINGSPGAYFWGEDVTVAPVTNFDRIQLMTQRQYVTAVVVRDLKVVIGVVPGSTQAALQLIQGELGSILQGLLAAGLIGQYQDDSGNVRAFDPSSDIIVFQDQTDDSKYYYNFAWFSRNVIKRLFGLYSLNSNDFSTGVALTGS